MRKKSFRPGIKFKLAVTMLVALLFFVGVSDLLWYRQTYRNALESAIVAVNDNLRVSNNTMNAIFREINYIVVATAINRDIVEVVSRSGPQTDEEVLRDNRLAEDYLLNVTIYKYYLQGMMVGSLNTGRSYSIGVMPEKEMLFQEKWLPDIRSLDQESVFIPTHVYANQPASQSGVISVIHPILSEAQITGFVMADIPVSALQSTFETSVLQTGAAFMVDPATGSLVFGNRDEALLDQEQTNQLLGYCTESEGFFFFPAGEEDYLTVYQTSELTGWISVALIPQGALMKEYNAISRAIFAVQGAIILLMILVVYLVAHMFTRDVLRLNRAVRQVGNGDMTVTVRVRSKDEVGELSQQFNSMVAQLRNLFEQVQRKENEKHRSELRALQAEINPHFLANTLNTIKLLATMQGSRNILEVTESLSRLLHAHMDKRSFVTVEEEMDRIRDYITLMQYKYIGHISYQIMIDPEVRKLYMPQMLLQPIVENAILHGIAPLKHQGVLLVKAYLSDGCLKMSVQDNGIGISPEKQAQMLQSENSDRIGFANVLKRIRLYFGETYGISIKSEEGLFTIITLSLPAIEKEDVSGYEQGFVGG